MIPVHSDVEKLESVVMTMLMQVTSTLARLTFASSKEFEFLGTLARRILWAVHRWTKKSQDIGKTMDASSKSICMITAYLALVISAIRKNKFNSLFWLVGLSSRFFAIQADLKKTPEEDIRTLIEDILKEDKIIVIISTLIITNYGRLRTRTTIMSSSRNTLTK